MCGQGLGVSCAALSSHNSGFVFFGELSFCSGDICLNSASANKREIELWTGEGTKESAGTSTPFILPAALQATWCHSSPHFSCFMGRSGPLGTSSIQICHFILWTQISHFTLPVPVPLYLREAYLLFWCFPVGELWLHHESHFLNLTHCSRAVLVYLISPHVAPSECLCEARAWSACGGTQGLCKQGLVSWSLRGLGN